MCYTARTELLVTQSTEKDSLYHVHLPLSRTLFLMPELARLTELGLLFSQVEDVISPKLLYFIIIYYYYFYYILYHTVPIM